MRRRQGMTIGEASAVLVLEDLDGARRRGATIYAELAGYGGACEAYHPTSPEPEGHIIAAMIRAALADAGLRGRRGRPHQRARDRHTAQRSRRGPCLPPGVRRSRRHVPVNAIKSMIGHCLGAAGAIEAAVLALTIARGVIPPTINHSAPIRSARSTSCRMGPRDQGALRPVCLARVRRQRRGSCDAAGRVTAIVRLLVFARRRRWAVLAGVAAFA